MKLKVPFIYQPSLKFEAQKHAPKGLELGGFEYIELPEYRDAAAPEALRIKMRVAEEVWRKIGSQWFLPFTISDTPLNAGIPQAQFKDLVEMGFAPRRDTDIGKSIFVATDVVMRAKAGDLMYDVLAKRMPGSPFNGRHGFLISSGNIREARADVRSRWQSAQLCFIDGQCWQRVQKPIVALGRTGELLVFPAYANCLSRFYGELYDLSEASQLEALQDAYRKVTGHGVETKIAVKPELFLEEATAGMAI